MEQASQSLAKLSNRGVSQLAAVQESKLPRFSATALVMQVARSLWPSKADVALSSRTGSSYRMCRYWLAEKYNLSADDLVALLRTDEGFQILEAIMGTAKPVWWLGFKRGVKRAELRRQHKLIQKALDEDEQGELGI